MMYSEEFMEFASAYGGTYTVSSDAEKYIFNPPKDIADALLYKLFNGAKNKAGTSLDVECGYVNSKKHNAIATKVGDKYFIGVNYGLAEYLLNTFIHILSHPELLSEVGDSKKEKVRFQWINRDGIPYTEIIANEDSIIPNDVERLEAAMLMCRISLAYIFFHELSHVINGHIDYLESNFQISEINENESLNLNDLMQALEFDADMSSAAHVFMFIKDGLKGGFETNIEINDLSSLNNRIIYFLFSIGLVLRIFEFNNPDREYLEKASHPSPAIRNFYFMSTFILSLEKSNEIEPSAKDIITSCSLKWLAEVDSLMSIRHSNGNIHNWIKDYENFIPFVDEININSTKLRKNQLKQFSYF